jgi:phosphoglucomutase
MLGHVSAEDVHISELAGERVRSVLTAAPGDGNAIGGVKVIAENGWFAVRPSGTEPTLKVYAESFLGREHLRRIQEQAQALVVELLAGRGGDRTFIGASR